jgi:tryptophanyl-tRNA synthetase
VPVGDDQKQHVELARDIAKRFNAQFTQTFVVPEVVIRKEGARIMSLLDPSKKMSKSDANPNSYIYLLDDIEVAQKKIMKAVTDSGSDIDYDPINRPAIANLLTIYAQLGNRQIKRLVKDYQGKGYGEFKKDLAEVVAKFLTEFQEKYSQISDEQVQNILTNGAVRAKEIANAKMQVVRQVIGVN